MKRHFGSVLDGSFNDKYDDDSVCMNKDIQNRNELNEVIQQPCYSVKDQCSLLCFSDYFF